MEISKQDRIERTRLRWWWSARRRLRDDTQGALGSHGEPEELRPHRVAGTGRDVVRPGGGDEPDACNDILDLPVAVRHRPRGTRGDPSAKGRELEALGEVPRREAVRCEFLLEERPSNARLRGRQEGDLVDRQDAVHPAKVEGHVRAGSVYDLHPTDDARAPAVRDHAHLPLRTELEEPPNFVVVLREQDDARARWDRAEPEPYEVPVRPPHRVH